MEFRFSKNAIAMAVVAVTGATTLVAAPTASAATKAAGNYVAGDAEAGQEGHWQSLGRMGP